jgi:hypothetical protein
MSKSCAAQKRVQSFRPVPLIDLPGFMDPSLIDPRRALLLLLLIYVVPLGISRGELILSTIARKIAVSFVRFWFVGAVASQPWPSSE